MSVSRRARLWAVLAALSVGTALQVGANGCAETWASLGLLTFDFCSVLNCTGGTFFNLCSPIPLLIDCPGALTGP